MSRAAPAGRHVMVCGRSLCELIRGVLELRIGFVADIVDVRGILESLLEEYFYGGSFKDEFYEQLSHYRLTTDQIDFTRREILRSISEQVRGALGDIRPANHYSFQLLPAGDVLVTESLPRPNYGALRLVG